METPPEYERTFKRNMARIDAEFWGEMASLAVATVVAIVAICTVGVLGHRIMTWHQTGQNDSWRVIGFAVSFGGGIIAGGLSGVLSGLAVWRYIIRPRIHRKYGE